MGSYEMMVLKVRDFKSIAYINDSQRPSIWRAALHVSIVNVLAASLDKRNESILQFLLAIPEPAVLVFLWRFIIKV